MKLFIICPDKAAPTKPEPFCSLFSDAYSYRFIKHVVDDPSLCIGCEKDCDHCRYSYRIDFSENLVGVLKLPPELPLFADDTSLYLPSRLPEHDVTLVINVHEDLLTDIPRLARDAGSKALIVPSEAPDWISRGCRRHVIEICNELGIETAFPKPFCSLERKPGQPVINEFIRKFRIGKPRIQIFLHEGEIVNTQVDCSAPCGCTYFVAKKLIGKQLTPSINEDHTAKYWHSYPCVASMQMDPELGDTILHRGGYIHYSAVSAAVDEAKRRGDDQDTG
jgi:hypothetical protein